MGILQIDLWDSLSLWHWVVFSIYLTHFTTFMELVVKRDVVHVHKKKDDDEEDHCLCKPLLSKSNVLRNIKIKAKELRNMSRIWNRILALIVFIYLFIIEAIFLDTDRYILLTHETGIFCLINSWNRECLVSTLICVLVMVYL